MPEIRCYADVDRFGAETLDELEDLEQDLYHRLIEQRGSNLDDPDRGLGIEDMLSGTVESTWKTKIEAELRKDERVTAVAATITQIDTSIFRIEIQVEADEEELGLVLEADASGSVRRVT